MFFWKSSEGGGGGGGVISDPKNYIVDFFGSKWYILFVNFGKHVQKGREGGSSPIQKISLQILLVSKRYILVVNFGKKTSIFGKTVAPYRGR